MKRRQNGIGIATALGLVLMVSGCTQDREQKFADGEGENIYSKALFEGTYQVTTEAKSVTQSLGEQISASAQRAELKVAQNNAPNEIKSMFDGLTMVGESGVTYDLKFRLNHQYITAYKVEDLSRLSELEKHIALVNQESGRAEVPVFKYKLEGYGVVVQKKNDLDEELADLRLKQTAWEDASHVEVVLTPGKRLEVEVPDANAQKNEVFIAEKVDGRVLTRQQLVGAMNIALNDPDYSLFLTKLSGNKLDLFQVQTYDSLSESMKDLIKALDSGVEERTDIGRCSAELAAQVAHQISADQCVFVHSYEVPIMKVMARLKPSDGIETHEVEYQVTPSDAETPFIYVAKGVLPKEMRESDQINHLDPSRSLVKRAVEGKKFLFRRTLQDSPNAFDYTFTGVAGPLEIVRFVFERDRVRVVRDEPLVSNNGSTNVDVEPLLSIRAAYVKEVYTDASGNTLSTPRIESTVHTDPDAIAYLNWAQNSIPNTSSPLNYYGLEACFSGASEKIVSGVDQRLKGGVFNFSMETTYASKAPMGSGGIDCAGIGRAGYFDQVQVNYTFKERFSFRAYEKPAENPLMDVPYLAQKKLGFGLFTYRKTVPNDFGNDDTLDTRIPLPAIFDLSGERQITYLLAGIPSEGAEREAVIEATREVIADLNEAFRRALAGTPNERQSDVLVLKVEGEDGVTAQVGDLDVNHIYYVQKTTSVPIIGLGGAHNNPRSGEVEAANVFVYGGNIQSSVERLIERAEAKRQYRENMVVTLPEATESGAEVEAALDSVPAGHAHSHDHGQEVPAMPKAQKYNPHREIFKRPELLAQLKAQLPALSQKMRGAGERVKEFSNRDALKRTATQALRQHAQAAAIYDALHRAISEGDIRNTDSLEAFVTEELIEVLGDQLTAQQMQRLRATANHARSRSQVMAQMRDSHICLHDGAELGAMELPEDGSELDPLAVAMSVYKPTLAHEIGHNLGLRHNFIASYDQANWHFADEEAPTRDYSSVMDYMPNDHESYDGMGPQDVAALRAAYGGVLELHPAVLPYVQEENGRQFLLIQPVGDIDRIDVFGGKHVRIEDYKVAVGLTDWNDLTNQVMARLPLKQYRFCSDEDANYYPTCARFDQGTTPGEIVDNIIDDYRSYYSIRNLPNDRINFGWYDFGQYIGRLFRMAFSARQFLEETIYLAITGGEDVGGHVEATVKALDFFHEIVRTPDASSLLMADERFEQVPLSNGATVTIEKKWTENLTSDLDADRLAIRGIEFDKIIALIMLTERRLGFPRYEKVSLRFSYPEFEQLVFDAPSALDLPTVGLLTEVLGNNVRPAASTPLGLLGLGGRYESRMTEGTRLYAMIGALIALDVDGLEAADNNASLFRVLSGFQVPGDVDVAIQQPGSESGSSTLSYWTNKSSESAMTLINTTDVLAAVGDKSDAVSGLWAQWIALRMAPTEEASTEVDEENAEGEEGEGEGEAEEEETEVDPLAELAALINEQMSDLPNAAGPKTVEEIEPLLVSIIELSQTLDQVEPFFDPRTFALILEDYETELKSIFRDAPSFALAFESVPAQDLGLNNFSRIMPYRPIDLQQGILFRNVEIMNQLFYLMHDEYNR